MIAAMRIAIDAMGGDNAPAAIVDGAVRAARETDARIILVGRADAVEAELARHSTSGLAIEVVHAPEMIAMDELAPAQAVRNSEGNSLSVGTRLLRTGEADGFVTAGNTGASMTAAAFGLGRIRGVRRPALVGPFPTTGNYPCALIDIGANVAVRPVDLLLFGVMGAAYAQSILDIESPRVGLVTIGEERGKGTAVVQAALPLLESSTLNFVGNLEGRDIPLGGADVAVTDGFTGNVLLKFAEGLSVLVRETLEQEARRDPFSAIGGILMRPAFGRARKRWDYRRFGGAMLLGVRGTVVIGHGRSDDEAIVSAVRVAMRGVERRLVGAITEGVRQARRHAGDDALRDADAEADALGSG